jgi:hypothetical protein
MKSQDLFIYLFFYYFRSSPRKGDLGEFGRQVFLDAVIRERERCREQQFSGPLNWERSDWFEGVICGG